MSEMPERKKRRKIIAACDSNGKCTDTSNFQTVDKVMSRVYNTCFKEYKSLNVHRSHGAKQSH